MGRPRKVVQEDIVAKTVETPVEIKQVELTDEDEIDIIALDSNVTYWDKATDITYFWEEVGEIIAMPYSVIKNMWNRQLSFFY